MTTTPNGIPVFHADHGLGPAHLAFIDTELEGWDGSFRISLLDLPKECPALMSGLYGPACGDEPVSEDDVDYIKRGERPGPSRIVNRPCRPVRKMVLICGPTENGPAIYTAYGSQTVAPREWWDSSLKPHEALESAQFWAEHALSNEA